MPEIVACYFGTLTAVTHKSPEITKDWKDDLVGSSGLIAVIETTQEQQCIVYEIIGHATVSTTAGTVEISEDKLIARTRNTIYEFKIDRSSSDIARAACLRKEIDNIAFLLNCDSDRERANRLLRVLALLHHAVSLEIAPLGDNLNQVNINQEDNH